MHNHRAARDRGPRLVAHGERKHCKVTGRKIEELDRGGHHCGDLVRADNERTNYQRAGALRVAHQRVIMAHHDTVGPKTAVVCQQRLAGGGSGGKLFQVGWFF